MRKKSKNPRRLEQDKADRALQDYYREKYKGHPCEVCGRPFDLMHHHVEKSKSNFLRYDERNLIFLCRECHNKIHFQDHQVVSVYSIKRGKEWVDEMNKLRLLKMDPRSINELRNIKWMYTDYLSGKD